MLNSSLTSIENLRNNFANIKEEAIGLAKNWGITPEFEKKRQKRLKIRGPTAITVPLRMRCLVADNVGEPLLKSLWLGRLPNGTPTILAALNENIDQLATVADKINDLTFYQ
ncbi:hypothetical protein TNCV_1593791 [Trichonephila clavipes]|nr:hypothetical protein TNCV_1593791 [Trichonephila clavipes]